MNLNTSFTFLIPELLTWFGTSNVGRAVQSVEAPRHKTGGSWFDFRWSLCNVQVTYSICPHSVALLYSELVT
jgi:hypothetical protein